MQPRSAILKPSSRAPAFRLSAPIVREHPRQRQIADLLRRAIGAPGKVSKDGVTWFSIDHAAAFGDLPSTFLGRGIIAGIPDLVVLHRGRAHWIEVKADDGVLEPWQQAVATAILLSGCPLAIARDAFEVLDLLDRWEIPYRKGMKIIA